MNELQEVIIDHNQRIRRLRDFAVRVAATPIAGDRCPSCGNGRHIHRRRPSDAETLAALVAEARGLVEV